MNSSAGFNSCLAVIASACINYVLGTHLPPVKRCFELEAPIVHNATVTNITAVEVTTNHNTPICEANIYLTHGDAADSVKVQIYLPLSGYTGRFQGLGGGGMVAGYFDDSLADAAAQGFVAGSTDAGRPNATIADDTWAGNDQLLRNFAYLSIHEMTVVGKNLAEQFYGSPVTYAYYQGCSNGGRQGYEEAQRYPDDYQGILANAPGISWDRWLVADMFPYLVEASYNDFPGSCIWEAITAAAVESCDGLDGGLDGVVNLPFRCKFNASTMVGINACHSTISTTHAEMWNKITDGPRDPNGDHVWGGLIPGTNFTQLAGDQPFSIARAWTAAFVEGNRTFDVEELIPSDLYIELRKAEEKFRETIGADNTDLSSFRDAGGKLLSWHGLVDQVIPSYGTIKYREDVERRMGGNAEVNQFYRFFLAPGVDHCGSGSGAVPTSPFSLLVDWVEHGIAPEKMPAHGVSGERDLCLYPKDLIYKGSGRLSSADSWTCTSEFSKTRANPALVGGAANDQVHMGQGSRRL